MLELDSEAWVSFDSYKGVRLLASLAFVDALNCSARADGLLGATLVGAVLAVPAYEKFDWPPRNEFVESEDAVESDRLRFASARPRTAATGAGTGAADVELVADGGRESDDVLEASESARVRFSSC